MTTGHPVRVALCAGGMIAAYHLLAGGAARAVDHPDLFEVASPDFPDNGMLTEANAGVGTSPRGPWTCGGQNISPALAWSHAPADTKSFAVIMDDPDAAMGRGGNHWITYDIPLGTLKAGLTKAEFVQQIQGHNLAEASIMARYQRGADGRAAQAAR